MSEKEKKTFGERVLEIRKRLRLNQKNFGKGIGISVSFVSEIENDEKRPGYDFFYNIVKVFKVNLNYLLFEEGEVFIGDEEKEGILPKRIKTGNPDVDKFWYCFFNFDVVKYHALLEFSKMLFEGGGRINDEYAKIQEKSEKE